ncbi:thiopeptide-type bacteriocin biosynthesis protein [Streptomyces sulphureus]|uniref:thiopeptide-type bacteriocin biosynthesis protein n=1 Tax=Streptomyces sulphureus TaxID=47758 RepID=UPI0003754623|nr:thiopeptide-type bacteriocin biosynthesis protein [Streptomyces sulphureus]
MATADTGLTSAELRDAADNYRRAGREALTRGTLRTEWHQLNLQFDHWPTADATARDHLAPLLDQAQEAGELSGWWFIRKHPCWRLRLRTLHRALPEHLRTGLTSLVNSGHLHRWWPTLYEPETAAFGGETGIHIAHDLFTADSHAILHPSNTPLGRRELSVLLCTTLFRAAGLEWYETGDTWHRVAEERPRHQLPHAQLDALTAKITALLHSDISPNGALLSTTSPAAAASQHHWAFHQAGTALGEAARNGTLQRGLRQVLTYHVLFHWNRLGLPLKSQAALAVTARKAILDPSTSVESA